ncbi:MAG: hypothetical protein V2A67_03815 [Bacteroidota bacterium]
MRRKKYDGLSVQVIDLLQQQQSYHGSDWYGRSPDLRISRFQILFKLIPFNLLGQKTKFMFRIDKARQKCFYTSQAAVGGVFSLA